jgi:predicted HTH domain antitoxin
MVQKGVSKAIRASEDEPVLVRRGDKPAAWILSAKAIERAASRGDAQDDLYHRAVRLLAVDLFDRGVLSTGQAARLAGMPLADFVALCDRLEVPVLREGPEELVAEVDPFERWLQSIQ